ncbi:MAG TPA: D-ribose pyranase [Candidatus Limiplasma sp.]|mgnify:CR=1 FL=1|nr:D-ribose pyranase [Candidatus Limiplasma sp.]
MKLGRILNKKLNTAIADMGHGEMLIVCDAGMKIPTEAQRIDLALEQDVPTVEQVLKLLVEDFCYERVIVTQDLPLYNPNLYKTVEEVCTRCPIEQIPYDEFMRTLPQNAKYIVRTGSFSPYADIALVSAIDAPKWFTKPGVKVPPVYKGRV